LSSPKVLIENDFKILTVAEDDVDAAAASLGVTGVKVMPLRADLSTEDGNERLVAAVAGSAARDCSLWLMCTTPDPQVSTRTPAHR
jgi:hypothetical protein